jgi:hypothetical protein
LLEVLIMDAGQLEGTPLEVLGKGLEVGNHLEVGSHLEADTRLEVGMIAEAPRMGLAEESDCLVELHILEEGMQMDHLPFIKGYNWSFNSLTM